MTLDDDIRIKHAGGQTSETNIPPAPAGPSHWQRPAAPPPAPPPSLTISAAAPVHLRHAQYGAWNLSHVDYALDTIATLPEWHNDMRHEPSVCTVRYLVIGQQAAGEADVDGGLHLVAGQHPDAQPRRPQPLDALRHPLQRIDEASSYLHRAAGHSLHFALNLASGMCSFACRTKSTSFMPTSPAGRLQSFETC